MIMTESEQVDLHVDGHRGGVRRREAVRSLQVSFILHFATLTGAGSLMCSLMSGGGVVWFQLRL